MQTIILSTTALLLLATLTGARLQRRNPYADAYSAYEIYERDIQDIYARDFEHTYDLYARDAEATYDLHARDAYPEPVNGNSKGYTIHGKCELDGLCHATAPSQYSVVHSIVEYSQRTTSCDQNIHGSACSFEVK